MANWTREDTQFWIHEQYLKLEAIDHYLKMTEEWLEERKIVNKKLTFVCNFMTIVWVNYSHGYPTSKREIFEILKFPDWEDIEDQQFTLPTNYIQSHVTHEEMLQLIITTKS